MVSKKQQTLDHGKKRQRDVVKGKRVVKRKYAKLKDRSSEFLPVPSGGAQHHPDAYIAALDKLEAQTKANMDVESREHRASVLRTAPSRIARITEDMPGLLARQLAGRTSRDADEKHTQWCRYLNRALNSGDDLGLTDKETKEARALCVILFFIYSSSISNDVKLFADFAPRATVAVLDPSAVLNLSSHNTVSPLPVSPSQVTCPKQSRGTIRRTSDLSTALVIRKKFAVTAKCRNQLSKQKRWRVRSTSNR
jgi:hypothetical protein